MKKFLALACLVICSAAAAPAQSVVLPPGKIAVFKGGDSSGTFNISVSKVQPCFIQVFDTTTVNQSAPLASIPLPTNAPNGIWINDHAGSEGGGISRTVNRQFLALEGYTGNILSPLAAKPSADPTVKRGLGTMDAFGNEQVLYQDLANWFGMPPGVTQNNPTGIASTDGTNFWGTGNVTGTSSEAAGTLFYNANYSATPAELQNYIQAAAQARIIGGTLYVVVPGQGVYNFLDPLNNDAVVPLPFDPNVPNPVQHVVLTNLFLNWGTTFTKIANFDMNPQGTVAYGADQTFGIVKFTNNNGVWQQAPYYFNSTNLGTKSQKTGTQGCFGICVDWSSANPIIYATTMETGTSPVNNSQGNPNQNRLIRVVDTGVSPGSSVVAQTLATASTTNETFRGIDFTPDLGPLITFVTDQHSTTNGGSASFVVDADSVYPLSYQWLSNGVAIPSQTNSVLGLSSLDTTYNGFTYQCVVTNQYGTVTSTPPSVLTVSASPQLPNITNAVAHVTAFVNGSQTFAAINPTGTEPFTYLWYFGSNALMDDGIKYFGSTSNSLTIASLGTGDAGNYYLVASNVAGIASNLVDVLTVNFHSATFVAGEPASVTTFVGLTTSLTADQTGGTPPFTNQWYKGTTALSEGGDYSGTSANTLFITPSSTNDGGSYKLVIANGAGSVTSTVATVTVLIPPQHSALNYSNQIYVQAFDTLPDPGSNSVNSINNPKDPGSINGVAYSLANPFDFTFPVINGSYVGGLGLSNLSGWYAAADTLFPGVDGITRFGAQNGDQTTGGLIDFGPNDNPGGPGTNRALGLMCTGTTGSTTFALKLINTSGQALNYVTLGYTGELWHNGTSNRLMQFGYTLDNTATNFVLSSESISNSTRVTGMDFSFPIAQTVTTVDGTLASNQVSLFTNSLALSSPWPSGGALWLIWALDYHGGGGGNGYAIDNLTFYGSQNPISLPTTPIQFDNVSFAGGGQSSTNVTYSFTNAPGAFFTVLYATNLVPPINWQSLGYPVEIPNGAFSTYQFTDTAATNKIRFYKIVSP